MYKADPTHIWSSETLVPNDADRRFDYTKISSFQFRSGDRIYEGNDNTRALYQLSRILDGSRGIIELDQNLYRLNEEGHLRRILTRHAYNLRPDRFHAEVDGKSKHSWPKVTMWRGLGFTGKTWQVYLGTTETKRSNLVFRSQARVWPLFRRGPSKIEWRDARGAVVAVGSTKPGGIPELGTYTAGKPIYCPDQILEIRKELTEKGHNLLIAAWCISIWKQNHKANSEFPSWKDIKEALQNHKWSSRGYLTHG